MLLIVTKIAGFLKQDQPCKNTFPLLIAIPRTGYPRLF